MAVALEAFLTLEDSLTNKLFRSFRKQNSDTITDVANLVDRGEYEDAEALAHDLSFEQCAEDCEGYIELVGLQSVLFGAAQLVEVTESSFYNAPFPEMLQAATAQYQRGLMGPIETNLIQSVVGEIARTRRAREAETIQAIAKIQKTTFAKQFESFTNAQGAAEIQIGSSLHTSRLSQWGFTTEARLEGFDTFRINEQLDNRICPVCERMHGKVFRVDTAHDKLETLLAVEDPADFAVLNPWPRQNRAAIERLENMSHAEIQANGWDTPPYHPLCRGLLSKTTASYQPDARIGAPTAPTVPSVTQPSTLPRRITPPNPPPAAVGDAIQPPPATITPVDNIAESLDDGGGLNAGAALNALDLIDNADTTDTAGPNSLIGRILQTLTGG